MTQRYNYFQSNRCVLQIDKLPDLSLYINGFPLPGVSLPAAPHNTPYRNVPVYGDKVEFNPLVVQFIVTEDFSDWIEVFNWIKQIGSPADRSKEFAERNFTFSDATAIIYSNRNNPIMRIKYFNLVPTSLSDIDITEEDSETVYKYATATFEYERFELDTDGN